jgi:hypothetical protein
MSDMIKKQVESNYKAFEQKLPDLLATHRGKFALMRDGQIIEFFDTARDAYIAGIKLFDKDRLFSVQEVIETPIDLGFFSHALPERQI